ncbi:MAG: hypothetical protein PWP31_1608 [Clostridia bacterium]|nr:hypothetical protein [Clostridia bacterium]
MVKKPHIGEVDYLRVFGLITIVILHVYGFYLAMPVNNPYSHIFHELTINLLRFGRQLFMFITGLVLFHSYSKRKLDISRFFNRRLKNLVIPYAIWTAIYLYIKHFSHMVDWSNGFEFVIIWVQNLLNGNGFIHLYYILVGVQFYVFFPLLITFFKPKQLHPTKLLIILFSGLLLYIVYFYLFEQQKALTLSLLNGTPWSDSIRWVMIKKDRLLLSYLPYYLLGGMVGLNLEAWRQWLTKHQKIVVVSFIITTSWVVGEYFYLYRYLGQAWALTISVFKPSIYLYSLTVIALLFNISIYLEKKNYMRHIISPLAANSLGIYLIHPAVLFFFNSFLLRYLTMPGYMLVIFQPIAIVGISYIISTLLSNSNSTRFIVGEAGNIQQQQIYLLTQKPNTSQINNFMS